MQTELKLKPEEWFEKRFNYDLENNNNNDNNNNEKGNENNNNDINNNINDNKQNNEIINFDYLETSFRLLLLGNSSKKIKVEANTIHKRIAIQIRLEINDEIKTEFHIFDRINTFVELQFSNIIPTKGTLSIHFMKAPPARMIDKHIFEVDFSNRFEFFEEIYSDIFNENGIEYQICLEKRQRSRKGQKNVKQMVLFGSIQRYFSKNKLKKEYPEFVRKTFVMEAHYNYKQVYQTFDLLRKKKTLKDPLMSYEKAKKKAVIRLKFGLISPIPLKKSPTNGEWSLIVPQVFKFFHILETENFKFLKQNWQLFLKYSGNNSFGVMQLPIDDQYRRINKANSYTNEQNGGMKNKIKNSYSDGSSDGAYGESDDGIDEDSYGENEISKDEETDSDSHSSTGNEIESGSNSDFERGKNAKGKRSGSRNRRGSRGRNRNRKRSGKRSWKGQSKRNNLQNRVRFTWSVSYKKITEEKLLTDHNKYEGVGVSNAFQLNLLPKKQFELRFSMEQVLTVKKFNPKEQEWTFDITKFEKKYFSKVFSDSFIALNTNWKLKIQKTSKKWMGITITGNLKKNFQEQKVNFRITVNDKSRVYSQKISFSQPSLQILKFEKIADFLILHKTIKISVTELERVKQRIPTNYSKEKSGNNSGYKTKLDNESGSDYESGNEGQSNTTNYKYKRKSIFVQKKYKKISLLICQEKNCKFAVFPSCELHGCYTEQTRPNCSQCRNCLIFPKRKESSEHKYRICPECKSKKIQIVLDQSQNEQN
eukprot:Anaeramoba_flamelloidesc39091_g1_i1.p1 GENE.c39091_g1_i1~~c39091_g1_i1.p1  ORF type:complete len:872 (-),score=261.58 c39091_g1_i1:957-3242(-)